MALDAEQVLYKLNVELHSHGVQYHGSDPVKAAEVLKYVKSNREGKPPCFARAFAHDDLTCRQCEEYRQCHLEVVFPRFTLNIPDRLTACEWCDGDFTVELYAQDGTILDYGCSTDGCRNTYHMQEKK